MIGNDESDDMKGAAMAGLECFLVTDHRILSENFVWTGERGSFEQMVKMLEKGNAADGRLTRCVHWLDLA